MCAPGTCQYIVEVTHHGWLPYNASYYYIDMEYCQETLEQYIRLEKIPLLVGDMVVNWENIGNTLEVALDIAKGLAFIHQNGAVHRDLKPRNGM